MAIWNFDPLHTQVEFSAKHLGMMTVRGNFTEVQATVQDHFDRGGRPANGPPALRAGRWRLIGVE